MQNEGKSASFCLNLLIFLLKGLISKLGQRYSAGLNIFHLLFLSHWRIMSCKWSIPTN